jgi:D-sedoheptulose 7-phosphate isomerase
MQQAVNEHIELFRHLVLLEPNLRMAARCCADAIRNKKKVMFVGNGGSAADAQHLAAELVGRLVKDRRPLPGLALTTDTSALTCIGNDYGFDDVFARQVEGLSNAGDVLIAISTSGNSPNVVKAVAAAKACDIYVVGFLGRNGGVMLDKVDLPIVVPHEKTACIQEAHIFLGHLLCQFIEKELGFA